MRKEIITSISQDGLDSHTSVSLCVRIVVSERPLLLW